MGLRTSGAPHFFVPPEHASETPSRIRMKGRCTVKAFRGQMCSREANSRGLTIIEILVAMMIFAIIAVGVGAALLATLTISHDNKAREVASSLAASEIDLVRANGDPFKVFNAPARTVSNPTGGIYTVKRTTAWVTPSGLAATCGTGGGALQYKLVTVSVSWQGMRSTTDPVITDTLLAPTTRINDPTKGTILLSVVDAKDRGKENVTFTISPSLGAVTLRPTDEDGCSFLLQVPAGTYTITLNTPGMVDFTQSATPAKTLPVTIGASTSFAFKYDDAATVTLNYASNRPPAPAPSPIIPADMSATFSNSYGVFPKFATGPNVKLHPWEVGYQAVAGTYRDTTPSCVSVDPESWAPDTRVSPPLSRLKLPAVALAPLGTVSVDIPMGIVDIERESEDRWVTAVSQVDTPIPGQQSCGATMTYRFGQIMTGGGSSRYRIALPFGSWRLYTTGSATDSSPTLFANPSKLWLVTPGLPMAASGGLFALDPR
ncbi:MULTISPECIES: prepilin-type N-terminal cleavage/methylation domain-containing protein [Cryobacterium]|uniref:Prepilin-type N-terminal cleavage/methylation domain-containing protein n=1 Tax=Cryobacterium breve TaxID=1259258 RepID=A0ABY2J3A7_9MICO|nr:MULTISPECIES: prepilin-type N-terminal cleavage/methylation domain-containing protein [Cryobacterium]TFC91820.1 prepilin-type N-terminal cleavage/methylation domain-containing protein [Cryobacterium sp. TmT3-12]TFC98370.1 prepilin-type N-terminal cleavage/methylation domain-containing protein [Cryobacterium breve]